MSIPAYQYEMFAEFGIAAEKARALEIAAGNVALSFLAFLYTQPGRRFSTEETAMFRGIVDDLNRKTFGRLLDNVNSHYLSGWLLALADSNR
jgi:hypothetical protein